MKKTAYTSLLALSAIATNTPALAGDEIQTGYFIDAPVTGLFYKTSSNLTGTTNKGAFNFKQGDVISFYLGSNENSYLLSQLSSQKIITPTLATTKPSRSINMTRLLLSLDSTPQDQQEILLVSDLLSSPEFQRKLQHIDLNTLSLEDAKSLHVNLVSAKQAVNHLNQSQKYIEEHFASDEIIFAPLNKQMSNIIIKKRDYAGRVCAYDLRLRKHPKYNPPIGKLLYEVTSKEVIEYPSVGDHFNGCNLKPSSNTETLHWPLKEIDDYYGIVGCAAEGCKRNDLNGFAIDDFNDDGDWKYRSLAINFDPTTQLLMEKSQGLGKTEHIHHQNKSEQIWFTYPLTHHTQVPYEGVWKQTTYKETKAEETCLLIHQGEVKSAIPDNSECPQQISDYKQVVTHNYSDMWWVTKNSSKAAIEQLNIAVRWYPTNSAAPKLTTWEYLPAGKHWDQGILYRYQQTVSKNQDGSDKLDTHTISEFVKVSGVQI
ncbi:chromosome partitioning protein ParA [Vibrio intestinalis]|uniref:chromosome partitioning protein ParA n=1 Tax=Vibrio intestinalis TaxID=2933291 RepID=UPI0021A276DE|nr:chromosome partitioning protein ParA [Vibrio intestinalis]